ncbi:hypothetical protein RM780_07855 [Streptomyces sp. DSM 44917]|uniref:Uncharacterized protein n=1 Tax=Streptomyces boetiae TaxID=3075541 RepID=A0ABU2L679_9ACTN|nr:hypothetical protein [Streptomyces sp. DSM 44917]MDT0306877.1 hypothetical protein [Streptomyces sp. DSM 44917]
MAPFPWRPGMRVDDVRLNEHLPVTATKSATETRTSTTVTADPELVVALDEGTWDVRMRVSFAGTATVNSGVVVQWLLSTGVALVGFRLVQGPAPGSSGPSSVSMRASVNSATTSVEYGASASFATIEEACQVAVPSGGGTVTFGWGKAAAGAQAQIGGGSWINAHRVA